MRLELLVHCEVRPDGVTFMHVWMASAVVLHSAVCVLRIVINIQLS